jgi:hypothetical protein
MSLIEAITLNKKHMEKIMSLNFGTSFMSTKRETESCKVFVGFVLPSTWISNPGMTYKDRTMGHCLWMDGWMMGWMDGKLHEKQP